MNSLFEKFANLSAVGKVLVVGAIIFVIAGLFIVFAGSAAVWVVIGGVLLVVFLVMAYQTVLSGMSKKRSSPFEKAMASAGGMLPGGVTEPARRARLDDLRRVFESGIEKFRAAGKNLYALPWYLVVGEPGSGKTEAVRHCNVGFPPGLQDELQGSGGTLNMNWWFTNHAVLLDTAGRLMFEEVQPGTTSEWQEFLKLLKKFRPNCPVNGLLLVIPAESLIRDTADQIEKKASRIAKQLDTVQRALGVRFPVFVVITKADLINGFREFFDSVQDPTLQHQMLGWSNPASLDEPFKPELIDEHLRVVQSRLARRRLGLMLDPVHTENPKARRTDQVDALYAFPEAITSIGPRLSQYLSMIFVQGEWSAKPLFLRGIYFTSSMREGSALDADLAKALGVPVDQLPEGRVWERDRAFFLRDLFMAKVFRERGLVTAGSSVSRLRQKRAAVSVVVGGVGLLALAALTFLGSSQLRATVSGPLAFWKQVNTAYLKGATTVDAATGAPESSSKSDQHLLPVVAKLLPGDEFYQYRGDAGEDAADLELIREADPENRRRATFVTELRTAAGKPIPVPLIFRPAAMISGDEPGNLLGQARQDAARAIARASIARPLLDAARTRLRTDSDEFAPDLGPESIKALRELIRLYHGRTGGGGGSGSADWLAPQADPLVRYALLEAQPEQYQRDAVTGDLVHLDAAMAEAFGGGDGAVALPGVPAQRSGDGAIIRDAVRTYLDVFRASRQAAPAASGAAASSGSAAANPALARFPKNFDFAADLTQLTKELRQAASDSRDQPIASTLTAVRAEIERALTEAGAAAPAATPAAAPATTPAATPAPAPASSPASPPAAPSGNAPPG